MPPPPEPVRRRIGAGLLDHISGLLPAGEEQPHQLLLGWLIFFSTMVVLLGLTWWEGYLEVLLESDRSRLSWLILLLFGALNLHCAVRTWGLSVLLNETRAVRALAEAHPDAPLRLDGAALCLGSEPLPTCATSACLGELLGHRRDPAEHGDGILELYEARLKRPHERGWFLADLMLKLGLLGTIVGFILMLGSITEVRDLDVSSMQQVLREMSSGMATALYTTLAGLVGSILASWQYHHLDQGADEILEITRYLAETRGDDAPGDAP